MTGFLDDLDDDLRRALVQRLRVAWTHQSTAIEGNSLTEGETAFVIGEGLTIAGKPLKDHQEAVGHARAVDLMLTWVEHAGNITPQDLFALHAAVQTGVEIDIMKPVGAWKRESNGAMVVVDDRTRFNDTYADPAEVPALMHRWLEHANALCANPPVDDDQVLDAYLHLHAAFVRIHPFADGNGRMARLLSNLPVLRARKPPVLVAGADRIPYLRTLADWQMSLGKVSAHSLLWEPHAKLDQLRAIFRAGWSTSLRIVADARAAQHARKPPTEHPS